MSDEQGDPLEHSHGDKSERILEDAYLTGGVGIGGATPRLAAGMLAQDDEEAGKNVNEDRSWETHAVEEGDPGDLPPKRGLFSRMRGFFGN